MSISCMMGSKAHICVTIRTSPQKEPFFSVFFLFVYASLFFHVFNLWKSVAKILKRKNVYLGIGHRLLLSRLQAFLEIMLTCLLKNYQMIMAEKFHYLFFFLILILKETLWATNQRVINLHQHNHSITTMKLTHQRLSENDMRWTKHNLQLQYLPDTWSVPWRQELTLSNQNHWPILVFKTKIFKKKKHVREYIKDYFQIRWFPCSRYHFSWLSLVLSNWGY